MDDNSIMPFGKHKGTKLANVPAGDLIWYYDQGWLRDELKKYVEDNLDVLRFDKKLDDTKKKNQQ